MVLKEGDWSGSEGFIDSAKHVHDFSGGALISAGRS
jgi:hypothetical protein